MAAAGSAQLDTAGGGQQAAGGGQPRVVGGQDTLVDKVDQAGHNTFRHSYIYICVHIYTYILYEKQKFICLNKLKEKRSARQVFKMCGEAHPTLGLEGVETPRLGLGTRRLGLGPQAKAWAPQAHAWEPRAYAWDPNPKLLAPFRSRGRSIMFLIIYLYMYIYTCTYICVHMYMYMYIYYVSIDHTCI